jgi:TatD DNase family protein
MEIGIPEPSVAAAPLDQAEGVPIAHAQWIDIHAHLYDLSADDLSQAITRARRNGVSVIVNTPVNLATSRIAGEQIRTFPCCFGTAGISPFDVDALPEDWEESLDAMARGEKIIGIGEIGLDDSNPRYPPLSRQIPVFERQLDLARATGLPAVMHSRGAEETVLTLCVQHRIAGAVFHCYTGSVATLKRILDAGYYVSFSGIVTFKDAPLNAQVAYAPLDRICIETDSPYLAPFPARGRKNEPANAAIVGEAVAAIKKNGADACAEQLRQNFFTLFTKACPALKTG